MLSMFWSFNTFSPYEMKAKLLMWHYSMILWLYFLWKYLHSIPSFPPAVMTRLAPEYNTRHCGGYFCPYHFWRTSVMLSVAHWDWKRPDWLTVGPAVCSIDSFISSICAQLFCPLRPIPNSVNRCSTVHHQLWSGCFTENHLIWFGKELDP